MGAPMVRKELRHKEENDTYLKDTRHGTGEP